MKKILFLLLVLFSFLTAGGQDANEQVAAKINASDWFGLKEAYEEHKQGLIPFMDKLSQCFIGHFFNRPEESLPLYAELLNNYQEDLGASASSVMFFYADDLSKKRLFQDAHGVLSSLCDAMKNTGTEAPPAFVGLRDYMSEMARLDSVLTIEGTYPEGGKIPFFFRPDFDKTVMEIAVRVGEKTDTLIFDTGAGVNVVSEACAAHLGLRFLNARFNLTGVTGAQTEARLAVAERLRLGDFVVRNVPFYVADLTMGNHEMDEKAEVKRFRGAIGPVLLAVFKEMQIDFQNGYIYVPATPTKNPLGRPNLCFTSSGVIALQVEHAGREETIAFDTGAGYSAIHSHDFFHQHKAHIESAGKADSLRYGGMGGYDIAYGYKLPLTFRVSETSVILDSVFVQSVSEKETGLPANCLGFDLIKNSRKTILNLEDMYLYIMN